MLILWLDRSADQPPPSSGDWWMWIQSVRLEHWVAVAILVMHACLAFQSLSVGGRFRVRSKACSGLAEAGEDKTQSLL